MAEIRNEIMGNMIWVALEFTWFCTVDRRVFSQFFLEKVNFKSQILECPSIGEYWNIFGVLVLPENMIFMFFRTCWCYSEAYNTGTQKWSSIAKYSCTSIWDLKYVLFPFFFFFGGGTCFRG